MSTRRQCLAETRKTITTNAGLWLDKFICNQERKDTESRRSLIKEIAEISLPKDYAHWFDYWQQVLKDYEAECRKAKVLGRMAVGLGEESVLETSVALHYTYGVPYIPGSALKGLAASFARQHLGDKWQPEADTRAYVTVFGDTKTAGHVIFFDALPLPPSGRLSPDIITVHHQNYYQDGNAPPADWDSPIPVPFLSATGEYLIALAGPQKWVKATFCILDHALAYSGIGAKTSSGYGRMKLDSGQPIDSEYSRADQLIDQIKALRDKEVAGGIHAFYEQWMKIEISPNQKRRIAEAIVDKVRNAGREKVSLEKKWYKALLEYLG